MKTRYLLIKPGSSEIICMVELSVKPSQGDFIIRKNISYEVIACIFDTDTDVTYINVEIPSL